MEARTNRRAQTFLSNAQIVASMQALASAAQTRAQDIPHAQQLAALSLSQCPER